MTRTFGNARSRCMTLGLCAAALLFLTDPVSAWTETQLTGYEPGEPALTVSPGSTDSGLTVSMVQGGVLGAPPASQGEYVLKFNFIGEDGKVECAHEWASAYYDLGGEDTLLADIYVGTYSAVPGLIGIWSSQWNPPDAWVSASGIPVSPGMWVTVAFDVSGHEQTGLNRIDALVFENMPGANGTVYVDNLRLRHGTATDAPSGLAAIGSDEQVDLTWTAVSDPGLDGYNIYRSDDAEGPFGKVNVALIEEVAFSDTRVVAGHTYYYKVSSVVYGTESALSEPVTALAAMTDEELMTKVQRQTFRYFWDFAHPVSGLARDSFTSGDGCVPGGTGMGLMAIVVGVERGFVTREQAALRVQKILTFLDEKTERYHGAWAHVVSGVTGETFPFSEKDDGADLVETAYVVQGLLTVRQYFDDPDDDVEADIRSRATEMWHEVEWDWFLRYPGGQTLFWHWSPNYDWDMNMWVRGFDETMITYLLAIASPTHPIPASCYYNGWAGNSNYANGNTYHGYTQWVGPAWGGPLFFTHYSFLGFDPRNKSDAYCNYYENNRNISLIHQAHCRENAAGFAGYSELAWGLTASYSPPPVWYKAHCPTDDNGTITPTAALSAMPYTPEESLATIRHFYYDYNGDLWGPYGFYDAFNPKESWVSDSYLAIDQGPIIVMIENYRTQLCWHLFMSNPEIKPMLQAIGWTLPAVDGDFNWDGEVDEYDLSLLAGCLTGPSPTALPDGCKVENFFIADFDNDHDVDLADFGVFQRYYSAD